MQACGGVEENDKRACGVAAGKHELARLEGAVMAADNRADLFQRLQQAEQCRIWPAG